jgi:hypothetical protein
MENMVNRIRDGTGVPQRQSIDARTTPEGLPRNGN